MPVGAMPWDQGKEIFLESAAMLKSIEHRIRNIENREFSVWGNELEA
jgi:hypothetical protein